MLIHADNKQENKSQSAANTASQKQSSSQSNFQFEDNRPESFAQRKMQEMADNFPPKVQLQADNSVMQLSKSSSDAESEMKKALGDPKSDKEGDDDVDVEEYYFDGDPEQYYIEGADMEEMISALDQYMSIELDGIDPTAGHLITMGTGWTRFLSKINSILASKYYGGATSMMLKKVLKTIKIQPEMPAGKTIPEIINFVSSKNGEVCNQSVGGGIMEILSKFRKI